MNSTIELIRTLSETPGISGHETRVIEQVRRFLNPDLVVSEDAMGNVVIRHPQHDPAKPTVLLDSHSDEIGFIVQTVSQNGLIRILPVGGWVSHNVSAHRFTILTEDGRLVTAITASKPPHFMSEQERQKGPSLDDIMLDVGATGAGEVREIFGIREGDPVVPVSQFHYEEQTQTLFGKAFDNRLGVALVVEIMNRLAVVQSSVNVVGVVSTQEEIGTRGAQVVSNRLQADLAIVLEGSPADDTFESAETAQGRIGQGVQIRFFDRTMMSHPAWTRHVRREAERTGIRHQVAVRKGGGTNAGRYHLAGEGIPSTVLGVPVRYAHTHHGISRLSDYLAARDLVEHLIQNAESALKEVFR